MVPSAWDDYPGEDSMMIGEEKDAKSPSKTSVEITIPVPTQTSFQIRTMFGVAGVVERATNRQARLKHA